VRPRPPSGPRVLRGGAANDDATYVARLPPRLRPDPVLRRWYVGFRVVLLPISSGKASEVSRRPSSISLRVDLGPL